MEILDQVGTYQTHHRMVLRVHNPNISLKNMFYKPENISPCFVNCSFFASLKTKFGSNGDVLFNRLLTAIVNAANPQLLWKDKI